MPRATGSGWLGRSLALFPRPAKQVPNRHCSCPASPTTIPRVFNIISPKSQRIAVSPCYCTCALVAPPRPHLDFSILEHTQLISRKTDNSWRSSLASHPPPRYPCIPHSFFFLPFFPPTFFSLNPPPNFQTWLGYGQESPSFLLPSPFSHRLHPILLGFFLDLSRCACLDLFLFLFLMSYPYQLPFPPCPLPCSFHTYRVKFAYSWHKCVRLKVCVVGSSFVDKCGFATEFQDGF